MSNSRIGNNPLDTLFSSPQATEQKAEAHRSKARAPIEREIVEKARFTVLLEKNIAEKARDVVFWTPGATLASFVEEAIEEAIKRKEKSRGEPFPNRSGKLPTGRPLK